MNTRRVARLQYFWPSSLLNRKWNASLAARRLSTPPPAQELAKKVKQYGNLVIDVPWNLRVKSTDPHEYPDMDTLLVKLFLTNNQKPKDAQFFSVDVHDGRCVITANENAKIEPQSVALCLVESPIQYDVNAQTTGTSGVEISSMVSDEINIRTEAGDIKGGKLQAKNIKLVSEGGSIDLKQSLQGNIELKTSKDGSIKAEKCLGTSLKMSTENGDVTLGSNYCEKATFDTVNGNLTLNNLHMESSVRVSGQGALRVSCLDGSLNARVNSGETKVQLVRLTGKSQIVSQGPIHLVLPRENNAQLCLKAGRLSIDEEVNEKGSRSEEGFETMGEIPLRAETSGSLRVTSASWAESLGLGNFMKS